VLYFVSTKPQWSALEGIKGGNYSCVVILQLFVETRILKPDTSWLGYIFELYASVYSRIQL